MKEAIIKITDKQAVWLMDKLMFGDPEETDAERRIRMDIRDSVIKRRTPNELKKQNYNFWPMQC